MSTTITKENLGQAAPAVETIPEHIVEIVSSNGDGAETCGAWFADVCVRNGYGLWRAEIAPADMGDRGDAGVGTSGYRVRMGTRRVTNPGGGADVVVALDVAALYSRIQAGALRSGTLVFVDRSAAENPEERVRARHAEAMDDLRWRGYEIVEIPLAAECRRRSPETWSCWALGLLCALYSFDEECGTETMARRQGVAEDGEAQAEIFHAGYAWGIQHARTRFRVPAIPPAEPMVAMNGNEAIALGVLAAGIEVCAMYPIAPAAPAATILAEALPDAGGVLHEAEDEIAAIGFSIGASYAGKTAATITSGPGLALQTEFLGYAVMAEVPLVVVIVQRAGPSTGQPNRFEQGDLLAALHASPGDNPKIILAPATIAECFHFVITARRLAENFRGPVILLSDAVLATGRQAFPKPPLEEAWMAGPVEQEPWDVAVAPFAWDPETGLSRRPVPGQRGGEHVVTGLAHNERSEPAGEAAVNQQAMEMRSRKLAVLQSALPPPRVHGDDSGDLLVVGWGSTLGCIEEAVDMLRAEGRQVSSVHLRFLSPLEPKLKALFQRFGRVITVEVNYSDPVEAPFMTSESRRYSQLAQLLRSQTLIDIDCWSQVRGSPIPPSRIAAELRRRMDAPGKEG